MAISFVREPHRVALRFLLALPAILAISSEASALWIGVPDFQQVVREAELCVYGRVALARELPPDDNRDTPGHFSYVAEFHVQSVIFGPCEEGQRIRVYYGTCVTDSTSFAPGEHYMLFLTELPARLEGYELPLIHWSAFHHTKTGRLVVPEGLRDPPATRDPAEFRKEIIYTRGPEITVQPTKPSFRCDEEITLKVTLRNPSAFREMKLGLPEQPDSHYGFRARFFTAHDMPLHSVCWSLQTEDQKATLTVVAPRESVSRTLVLRPALHAQVERAYRSVARVGLSYEPCNMSLPPEAWKGTVFSVAVAIAMECRHTEFGAALGDAGERYAFELAMDPDVARFVPGEPVRLWIKVAHKVKPVDERRLVRSAYAWGSCWAASEPSGDRRGALASQLQVVREGRSVIPLRPLRREGRPAGWLESVAAELGDMLRGTWRMDAGWVTAGFLLRLDRDFNLTRSGRYSVRLIVPPEETGEKRPLSSNVLEFTLAAPAAE